ncbi:guanine deaminase [Lyngbya sp. PCC 8106]|uniref:guanine deaminase n=1 Tax=Lyngbya sp. (strain PCC 8106) TaxID=313612 RepID=UPI0000EAC72A|nr:guanine deaminase [Lyngbya sp. PCC 8106]EAW38725.1 guanine deaminase [Lyngbya sp. PCC 8106]
MVNQTSIKAFRGAFLDCVADPFYESVQESIRYIPDGLMIVENGKIKEFGSYENLQPQYRDLEYITYLDKLIVPGFIDLHVHYPQTEMIASDSNQLLDWLERYTFLTESQFKDPDYSQQIAQFFLNELLRNGTTTAVVLTTVFSESVDAFFEAANSRNLRMIAGKVMMDRQAPEYLLDTAKSAYEDSQKLIEKWHNKNRLLYAVTPRFAITSTPEQLHLAGKLLQEYPDVYLHTHLSENVNEVKFVAELFPDSLDYLHVYEQFGLVGKKSIFAHGIHLSDSEFKRLSATQSAIAFCPTSNLFLGSGLFKLHQAKSREYPIPVGLATDVGGGTSFSLLQTANEAYKVTHLQGQNLSGLQALFLATLGSAEALSLDDKIGNFEIGKEADFVVLDGRSTPLLTLRTQGKINAKTLEQIADFVFALMILGDDRAVAVTYILGEQAYIRSGQD